MLSIEQDMSVCILFQLELKEFFDKGDKNIEIYLARNLIFENYFLIL